MTTRQTTAKRRSASPARTAALKRRGATDQGQRKNRARASKARTERKPTRLFVYGTLLKWERHDHLLAGARLVDEARTKPRYRLRDFGGYPTLHEGGEHAVLGEVYEVDSATLAVIDDHEDHPRWFQRTSIELEDGTTAEAYLLPPHALDHREIIESGSWRALQEAYRRSIIVHCPVSELGVKDALVAACAGAMRRWADAISLCARPRAPSPTALPSEVHFELEFVERCTAKRFALRHEWPAALGLLARHRPRYYAELLLNEDSGAAGDVLVQLAAFGYEKYLPMDPSWHTPEYPDPGCPDPGGQ
jgi:gamma-glutamylaminecyclotransferase